MVNEKTTALNKLFKKWEDETGTKNGFYRDGIICEDRWNNAKIKVAFLLKEVNDPECKLGSYDFRTNCCKNTWPKLGQWAYGLQQAHTDPEFSSLTEECWDEAFRASAVINLKKIPGGNRTDWEQLSDHVRKPCQKGRLQEELQIIDPDIVVCCGRAGEETAPTSVFNIAGYSELYSHSDLELIFPRPDQVNQGIRISLYYENETRRVWVNYVHPSYFKKTQKDFYTHLMNAYEAFKSSQRYQDWPPQRGLAF